MFIYEYGSIGAINIFERFIMLLLMNHDVNGVICIWNKIDIFFWPFVYKTNDVFTVCAWQESESLGRGGRIFSYFFPL